MLVLQKPNNPQLYYIVSSFKSQELQKNGFMPKYSFGGKHYYIKTKDLISYMEGGD